MYKVELRERMLQEVVAMPSRRRDQVQSLDEQLETMAECARRVLGQTKAPIVQGVTQCADKLLSV
jgi:hypothetical protein